ncbi:bidirectional sugar transporter SWEET15, partial [Striga asiatica]
YFGRRTPEVDPLPYVVTFSSTVLWIYYGVIDDHNVAILTINSVGSILELVYILLYLYNAPRKSLNRTLWGWCICVLVVASSILITFFALQKYYRIYVVGWICAASSLLIFASPLHIVLQVWRTRDLQLMSLWLSLALTFSGVVWAAYGLLEQEFSV